MCVGADLPVEERRRRLDPLRRVVAPTAGVQVLRPLHADGGQHHVQERVVVVVQAKRPLGEADGQGASSHKGRVRRGVAREAHRRPVGGHRRRHAQASAAEPREACERVGGDLGAVAQVQGGAALPELDLADQLVEPVDKTRPRGVRVGAELRQEPAADPRPHLILGAHIPQHESMAQCAVRQVLRHADLFDRRLDPAAQPVH
mmetsp:Transcript_15890/g.45550  ORF Transcript_15890/g.45550 Transcript_15890/m.45550 type:complete len:203 (-) Transcript_15890:775-1383(-)